MKPILLLSILFTLFACSPARDFPTTPTRWTVGMVAPNGNGTNLYFVRPVETKGLVIESTWFVDSAGRFMAGDTLKFEKVK